MNIIQEIGGLDRSMTKNNKTNKNENRHELSASTKSSMRTRIISAIVMIALLVPAIFLGDWIYFALFSFLLAVACYEILGCAGKRTFLIYIIYFLFVAVIAYWPLFKGILEHGLYEYRIDQYFTSIYLPVSIVIIGFFLLFWLTVIYKDFTVVDASFLITMAIIIGLGFQCLFYLRYIPSVLFGDPKKEVFVFTTDNTVKTSLLLLFVLFSTVMTDTGAYFVGVFFGKNKINERISPKKTWEGFVGGIVISAILSTGVALIFAFCNYPIIPQFSKETWYFILPASLLIPLFATLGDFVFSSIKRYWGIKDYGKLIPGHGGVLDRLDSIIFSTIIASIFVFMLRAITDGGFNWAQFLV